MTVDRCETAIIGSGIAGIAAAYYLTLDDKPGRTLLIDRQQPMALTTAQSGENFRDYWPHPSMTAFASRSLDLMEALSEESCNAFDMRYFGYDFVSESAGRDLFGGEDQPASRPGVTVERDLEAIRRRHPHLSRQIRQVVHIERAGAFDVHALGSLLLSRAHSAGVEPVAASVAAVDHGGEGFHLQLETNGASRQVVADRLVLAPGPFIEELASMLGLSLPVESFLQRKILIPDPASVIPRDMPFTIFADPQHLVWSAEEAELLAAATAQRWLLDELPPGLHIKPESQDQIKLGWAYNRTAEQPKWRPSDDLEFPSIALRGASRFIPGLATYAEDIPTPLVQYAGYYTRTPENWPLIGPLPIDGLYTIAALSGYGTMCACAAGELCAQWMTGGPLPTYADHFHPDRHSDPRIRETLAKLTSDGQL